MNGPGKPGSQAKRGRGGGPTAPSYWRVWGKTVVGPNLGRGKAWRPGIVSWCTIIKIAAAHPGSQVWQSGLQAELPAIALPGPQGSERCEGV